MIDLKREFADIQATYLPAVDSGVESQYVIQPGLLVIPILGDPEDAPVVVRVHSPYTTRRSTFSYAKGAAPPLIPSPTNTRTGHTFLGGMISIPAPVGSAEGTLNFKVSGFYNFVLPQHVTVDGKIMFDAHPYPSGVDMLGAQNDPVTSDLELGGFYNTWKSQYFEMDKLASFRILG